MLFRSQPHCRPGDRGLLLTDPGWNGRNEPGEAASCIQLHPVDASKDGKLGTVWNKHPVRQAVDGCWYIRPEKLKREAHRLIGSSRPPIYQIRSFHSPRPYHPSGTPTRHPRRMKLKRMVHPMLCSDEPTAGTRSPSSPRTPKMPSQAMILGGRSDMMARLHMWKKGKLMNMSS